MSPAEPKPPSWPASKGWYDTLVSGVGALDPLPTGFDDRSLSRTNRWIGWRLRGLVLCALLACVSIVGVVWAMASTPWIDAQWNPDGRGRVLLGHTNEPALRAQIGQALVAIRGADGRPLAVNELSLLQRAPRWIVDGKQRDQLIATHAALNAALAQGRVTLVFGNGVELSVPGQARGLHGVGWAFWPLAALALVVGMVGVIVWMARPDPRNALYMLIAMCQAATLGYTGLQAVPGIPLPTSVLASDVQVRLVLDLLSAAAVVHAFTLHPTRLAYGPLIAAGTWLLALVPIVWLLLPGVGTPWWPAQGVVLIIGIIALAVLHRSRQLTESAFATLMQRMGFVVVGALSLLLVALAVGGGSPGLQQRVAEVGATVWTIFFASVVLLVPFLSRSRQMLREFALLAGISTVATSLDLLFVTVFALGQYASVALAVFISLGAYAVARDWIVNQLTGTQSLTVDRIFDRLYRTARAIEQQPEHRQELMEGFLRDVFEPLDMQIIDRAMARSRVTSDGSALLIPAPRDGHTDFDGAGLSQAHTWVLRHAHRGKRLFSAEDARLADRVSEQLRRAVAYDKAVERGRSEERRRIAQDLHDDIGARLLTLIYKAPTPELEDYIRHTLQDLKTLTRGLAASEHLLSHAVAEWKADVGQRVAAAQMALRWNFSYDEDIPLSVTQWSGLTRIIRELVTNAIYHAKANRLQVDGSYDHGRLNLWVSDDGEGRNPAAWSHGLGLGGVRKRVRALGGAVRWRENTPRGIICEVRIDNLRPAVLSGERTGTAASAASAASGGGTDASQAR